MLPEIILDNDKGSPNNNSGVPRTRGSLCLSPVTRTIVVDNKRKSWCGTPSSGITQLLPRRYGELGQFKPRSEVRNETPLKNLGDRNSPSGGAPSPSSCTQILMPTLATRSLSRESLLCSNSDSDVSSDDSGDTGYGATCDIGVMERFIRSHPIWFLPGIQRAGAFHLLQGKTDGSFIVRQSSQNDTMALSVRLPPDKGPYIEHYLIQSSGGRLGLETSENRFDNMPALVAHYANCCDELPIQLTLPKVIQEAKTRQQLSSLALLGQEFWRYSPPTSTVSSPEADLILNLNPLMSTFKTAEPSTPVVPDKPTRPNTLNLFNKIDLNKNEVMDQLSASCLRNDLSFKSPPMPPPRWSKPNTPQNNFTVTTTVTFSVKSQTQSPPAIDSPSNFDLQFDPKRMSPEGQCTSTTSSKHSLKLNQEQILSPNSSVFSSNGSVLSPNSDPSSLLSTDTMSPPSITKGGGRHSKRSKHKLSKHYQESDIVDSPTMLYYKSCLGDKISDYEDVWTSEPATKSKCISGRSFASPDLLQHVGNVPGFNNNFVSKNVKNEGIFRSQSSTPISNFVSSKGSIQSPTSTNELSNSTPVITELTSSLMVKQASPFYAEPADSLAPNNLNPVPRRLPLRTGLPLERHSNPPILRALSLKPRVGNENEHSASESDIILEQFDPDYESDWPGIANLISSLNIQGLNSDNMSENKINRHQHRESAESNTSEILRSISSYDNVEDRTSRAPPSEISELTEFSDPWTEVRPNEVTEEDVCEKQNPKVASIIKSRSFKDRMGLRRSVSNVSQTQHRDVVSPGGIGQSIMNYALHLADDKTTTFAQNIDNFIACTCESKEINPLVVMRNMRQFMSGMKNYLVKHGEKGLYKEIEQERNKLKSTEFLNLDALLETVMHKLVVKPLKFHLQKLFYDHYTKTGAIRLLTDNIQYVSAQPVSESLIKPRIQFPSDSALNTINQYFVKLQTADSPLEKLECLLAAFASIYNCVKTGQITRTGGPVPIGADVLLPLFEWVLVKTNFVAAEIEAEYMWGLLHPSLLSGESAYYLTMLSSAIHGLKRIRESREENENHHVKNDSILKVVVPDELHGSILTKTLPAKPNMTTKDVCKIIAHKARITNPQDFALYRLTDGEETMLLENECPKDFVNQTRHTILAYKRIDAKIAWPNQDKLNI